MRLTVSSLTVALLLTGSPAYADLDQATAQQLNRLEQKYFGRSYSAESDEARAARLERLVFGEASEGDAAGRIKKIVEVTGADTTPNEPAPSTSEVSPQEAPKPQPAPTPSRVDSDTDTTVESEDAYPRVVELENAILGRSYAGQPLSGRISRMEIKAFGHSSNNPDLSTRTDALEQYAEQKLHKRSERPADTDVADDSRQSTSQTDYPRVDALETAILGQQYAGQPLPDRLKRMEMKAFGAPSKSDDFSQRTDALEKYAEKTLHKKPFEPGDDSSEQGSNGQQTASGKTPFLSKIGRALVGMAGSTVNNFGTGGFGPGFGGPGYGGMGMGPGMQQRPDYDAREDQSEKIEDPAITDPSPPPANARLITKVSWCEMQVFGKTSPELHLEKRLDQLNEQLNFAPGKSNMELMDHIPELMKMVIAQKQPTRPMASNGKLPTH